MKPLILVKHSLPEIVENVPAREWKLSEEGRARARQLAERLKPYQPQMIISSVEPKARETAAIVAENLGLDFQTFYNLHEHERSKSRFLSKDEFHARVQDLFEKPDALVFGSETANEAPARFRAAVEAILKLGEDKTIVIVAHGTVIALYAAWMTGCDGYALWRELGLPSFMVLDIQSKTVERIIQHER